ncbi:hypothetical protein QE152_g36518 [Popillia japonica]|uniref:Uncharacterized protein n=1 Tax=Popillia japonica TaxID=7064 RepID=A0AAW1ID12_POPJA
MNIIIDNTSFELTALIVPLGQEFLNRVTWNVTKDAIEFTPNDDNVDVTTINADIAMNYQNDARNIINTYLNNSRGCQNESESCIKMRIVLKDDVPVRSKPRRLSYSEQKAVNEIIHDLLQKNVIRPSSSEYSRPIVLVSKKNKELRMCIDYQALNDKTLKENFPLPLIDDKSYACALIIKP